MIPEDLMRKYKYGYVHSCEMLNEPFVKDLIKENQDLKKQLKDKPDTEIIMQDDSGKKYSIIQTQRIDMEETLNKSIAKLLEENQELKKQLEAKNIQQKEFIKWLEEESKEVIRDAGYHQRICLDILEKYKEIIGVKDE